MLSACLALGIGAKTAEILADRGARVIMACRNVQKAEEVAENIRALSPGCKVVIKRLDLCSLASTREFAGELLAEEEKIDILVNNAGISGGDFKLTEDGFEEIYQANYLGPFLLTELLLPLLRKSPSARIVNTGSSAYFLGNVDLSKFATDIKTRNKSTLFRYGDSKLAMLMWTKAMAKELENMGENQDLSIKAVVYWLERLVAESIRRDIAYSNNFQESPSILSTPAWLQLRSQATAQISRIFFSKSIFSSTAE